MIAWCDAVTGAKLWSTSFANIQAAKLSPDERQFFVLQHNDTLHVWQFTNSPSIVATVSNLASGSDYAFGRFNAEPYPQKWVKLTLIPWSGRASRTLF